MVPASATSSTQSSEGKLTEEVEDIQKKHEIHRDGHAKKVKREQIQRRTSVKARVKARKRAKKSNALQKCQIFSDLNAASIATIIDKMEYEVHNIGTVICQQGAVADTLYLIMSGFCQVEINGEVVATLNELEIFGENALFAMSKSDTAATTSRTRGATVTAVDDTVQLLCLSLVNFQGLLNSGTLDEECLRKLKAVANDRRAENTALLQGGEGAAKEGESGSAKAADVQVKIEKVRKCLIQLVQSSEKLQKICLRLNRGDKSIMTLTHGLFEKLVSTALKKKQKMTKAGDEMLDVSFAKNAQLWSSATASRAENASSSTALSVEQLIVWLGF